MAIGDVYKVSIDFTDDDAQKEPSTGIYIQQNAATAPTITAVGDIVKSWWNTGLGGGNLYKDFVSADFDLRQVRLRRVRPLEPVEFLYNTGLPISGTSVSDPGPRQDATLVSLRTAKIGRSYRGRMYLPGMTEQYMDAAGAISAVNAAEVSQGIQGMITAFGAMFPGPCTAVVYSKLLDTADPIVTVLTDRIVRTQRRRSNNVPAYTGI